MMVLWRNTSHSTRIPSGPMLLPSRLWDFRGEVKGVMWSESGVVGGVNAEIDGPKWSQAPIATFYPSLLLSSANPPQLCDGCVVAQHLAQRTHALGANVVVVEAVGF